jgi:hypothetical protein
MVRRIVAGDFTLAQAFTSLGDAFLQPCNVEAHRAALGCRQGGLSSKEPAIVQRNCQRGAAQRGMLKWPLCAPRGFAVSLRGAGAFLVGDNAAGYNVESKWIPTPP